MPASKPNWPTDIRGSDSLAPLIIKQCCKESNLAPTLTHAPRIALTLNLWQGCSVPTSSIAQQIFKRLKVPKHIAYSKIMTLFSVALCVQATQLPPSEILSLPCKRQAL